jgi:tetratricopeptide (TPR) repeat protein
MYRKEVDALIKVIALKPDMGYAYMELAAAYNRLGQYHDAIENLQKTKKYFPKNPAVYNNLAVTSGKLGNVDEEIALLKKAISLRPRYGTARYNLGVVSLRRGERDEAFRQYEELKKFDDAAADALKDEIDKIMKDRKS